MKAAETRSIAETSAAHGGANDSAHDGTRDSGDRGGGSGGNGARASGGAIGAGGASGAGGSSGSSSSARSSHGRGRAGAGARGASSSSDATGRLENTPVQLQGALATRPNGKQPMAPFPSEPYPDIPDATYNQFEMMSGEELAGPRAELALAPKPSHVQRAPPPWVEASKNKALLIRGAEELDGKMDGTQKRNTISSELFKLMVDLVARLDATNVRERLAATRTFLETVLVRLTRVPEADREGFLAVMRNEMPCLHDSVLAAFAAVGSPLAILLGKGEHCDEHRELWIAWRPYWTRSGDARLHLKVVAAPAAPPLVHWSPREEDFDIMCRRGT